MASASGALVDCGVNHVAVHALPQDAGRRVDQWLDKNGCVNFVDVIFVEDRFIEAAERIGNLLRKMRLTHVENVSEHEPQNRDCHRYSHYQIFPQIESGLSRNFSPILETKHT